MAELTFNKTAEHGARLAGQVALITGGNRGLGRAMAEAFASEGATVAIMARTVTALNETADAIAVSGGKVTPHPGDLANPLSVEQVVAEVLERHGRIDILINNAAVEGPTTPVQQVEISAWDEVMAINVRGAFLCTRAVVPNMIAIGTGHIIFVSALGGGLRAYPLRLPYAVSKAAMIAMMQTVAAEVGPHGIRVNAITPGPVQGDRFERVKHARAEQLGKPLEAVEKVLAEKALTRHFPTPEEVAQVALFLCSPTADIIIGQSINLTMGMEIL
jgi:NAD(P)-dependent dehydrogenase (short-subunit alcohol dehydrogenase family)